MKAIFFSNWFQFVVHYVLQNSVPLVCCHQVRQIDVGTIWDFQVFHWAIKRLFRRGFRGFPPRCLTRMVDTLKNWNETSDARVCFSSLISTKVIRKNGWICCDTTCSLQQSFPNLSQCHSIANHLTSCGTNESIGLHYFTSKTKYDKPAWLLGWLTHCGRDRR